MNKFLEKLDKRRAKDSKKHGSRFKEKTRVESTPSTILPPSTASSWTIDESYRTDSALITDSEKNSPTSQGAPTEVSIFTVQMYTH